MSPEDVQRKLERLGANAHEVAKAIQAKGIKGVRGCPTACPVKRYLEAEGVEDPYVTASNVDFLLDGGEEGFGFLEPPGPVRAFILEFDCGVFPELDDRSSIIANARCNQE